MLAWFTAINNTEAGEARDQPKYEKDRWSTGLEAGALAVARNVMLNMGTGPDYILGSI